MRDQSHAKAAVQQVLVEPLQVQRSQVCQWNAADLRLDMVFQKTLGCFECGRSEFHSGVVLHLDFQPATHSPAWLITLNSNSALCPQLLVISQHPQHGCFSCCAITPYHCDIALQLQGKLDSAVANNDTMTS